MEFYVVFAVDATSGFKIEESLPRKEILEQLELTEGDECRWLEHLGGRWLGGSHRKYMGILQRKDFEDFLCSSTQ